MSALILRMTQTKVFQTSLALLLLSCLLFLPFGNADAPRNLFGGLAAILGLFTVGYLPLKRIKLGLLAYLGFCLASTMWAPSWVNSFRDFLEQALMPAGLFAGTYFLISQQSHTNVSQLYESHENSASGRFDLFLRVIVTSATLLAIIGSVVKQDMPSLFPLSLVKNYWPGVGQATTFAAMWAFVGLSVAAFDLRKSIRILGLYLFGVAIYVASVEPNRAVWISIALIVGLLASYWIFKFSKMRPLLKIFFALFLTSALMAGTLQKIIGGRYGENSPLAAKVQRMIGEDARLEFWSLWITRSDSGVVFGEGFGQRTVSDVGRHLRESQDWNVDTIAFTHPHNIFVNYYIQMGALGITLWLQFLAAIGSVCFLKPFGPPQRDPKWCFIPILLTTIYLQKNATDVWTIYGPHLFFWVLLGLFLARVVGAKQ